MLYAEAVRARAELLQISGMPIRDDDDRLLRMELWARIDEFVHYKDKYER